MSRTKILLVLVCVAAFLDSPVAAQSTSVAPAASAAAHPAPSLAEAKHLYDTGQFAQAEAEYRELTTGPRAALAYVGLAELYLQEKKPTDAYAAVAQAAKLAPDSLDVKTAEGEIDFRQGKIENAESEFVAAINGGTKNARAFLGLARVSDAASYYQRGKFLIDRAHALGPADPDVTRVWIGTLSLADRIAALREYLSHPADDDADVHTSLEHDLSYLLQQEANPADDCHIVSQVSTTETALQEMLYSPEYLRGFGLKVRLNGATANLLLDTGASGILVSSKFARKAGLKPAVAADLHGIGDKGPAAGYLAFAESIQVGGLEFKGCPVEVMNKRSVAGENGLIAPNVFGHFLVDLDFPGMKLRLSPLPARPGEPAKPLALATSANAKPQFYDRYVAPQMKDYTLIFRVANLLLIPTMLDDNVSTLFAIDTGANLNFISPAAAREVTKVSEDDRANVYGLNGRVKDVYDSQQLTLTFANFRQKNVGMISFDTESISDDVGTEVSGMLGFTTLRMLDMKIDYRDGLVWFGYDAKRWGR